MADRYAPPDDGLPIIESVCSNGHPATGELAWRLPLVFVHDLALTKMCPECGSRLWIKAGSYERSEDQV